MRRLEKKIVEAAEQSGRVVLPKVEFIENFQNAFSGSKNPIVFHTTGVLAREAGINEKKELDIFVGPEGGWTEKEVEIALKQGVPVVTLGEQILRAETAAIAALSVLMFS